MPANHYTHGNRPERSQRHRDNDAQESRRRAVMLFQSNPVAAKERSSRKNRSHHDIRARRDTATKSGGTDFSDE